MFKKYFTEYPLTLLEKIKSFFIKNSSCVVSISALITSIAALFVAFDQSRIARYQSDISREHNILTVRPLLTFDISNNFIKINNEGFGPAILTNLFVKIDSNEYIEVESKEDLTRLLSKNRIQGFSSKYMYPKTPLSSGKQLVLFEYEKGSEYSDETISNYISRVKFKVKYSGIYENTFHVRQ